MKVLPEVTDFLHCSFLSELFHVTFEAVQCFLSHWLGGRGVPSCGEGQVTGHSLTGTRDDQVSDIKLRQVKWRLTQCLKSFIIRKYLSAVRRYVSK